MAPVRAVLLDYGHTIIDFAPAEENLLTCYTEVRELLTEYAEREVPEARQLVEEVSRGVGRLVTDSYARGDLQELDIVALYEQVFETLSLRFPRDLVRGIAEMEHRALLDGLQVRKENLEALSSLRDLGVALGLVSNATFLPELMHEDIRRLGIAGHMDAAVFSSEVGVRKPHPRIYEAVLERIGARPVESIFVGDRLYDDLSGAQKLGMLGVLTREFRQEDPAGSDVHPDHVIDRLPELVPYVADLVQSER